MRLKYLWVFFLFLGTSIFADTIELTTGEILSGKVVEYSSKYTLFKYKYADMRIPNNDIKQIIINDFGSKTTVLSIPQEGLIAEYLFNGDANDSSGNRNHGTIIGAASTVDRKNRPSSAYYFNGSSYIKIPNSPSLNITSSISIAAWYSGNSFPTTWPPIIKKTGIGDAQSGGYTLEINTSPVWEDGTNGSAIAFHADLKNMKWAGATGHVVAEGWHFVVGTYDGVTMKLYYDGKLIKSNAYSGNITVSTNDLNIGRDPSNTDRFFKGYIDDVRIYSRALSSGEIEMLYNAE